MKYPKSIQTLIDSEQLSENLFLSEQTIEKTINDKKYVIQFVIHKIRACLVFDSNDNLIDFYDYCASHEPIYKNKSYYSWIKHEKEAQISN